MKMRILIALSAVVWLAGCGTPGAPRPPSLRLPQTVSDLAATRVGSTVTLSWTEPQRTTDGENIRALGPTLICMGVNDFPMTHCDETVADLSQAQYATCAPKIGQPVTCAVTLPANVITGTSNAFATFAIEVLNQNNRSAGISNQIQVALAPALPPAVDVAAILQPEGVEVSWSSVGLGGGAPAGHSEYHVFRRENGKEGELDLGPPNGNGNNNGVYCFQRCGPFVFVDKTIEWGKTYTYRIAGVTTATVNGKEQRIEGDPSPAATVEARDTFPPAVPTGLQAVASGVGQPPFIDLTWAPNTDSDLAGYNVYRHEEGQAPVKINAELVKAPAYRDERVERGHKYFYAVTAVDLRGNESGRSPETSESVP